MTDKTNEPRLKNIHQVVAFMKSVIACGETLSPRDLADIDIALAGYDHAAAELRWIPIRSADDLPKEDGYYLATCGSVGIDPDDTTSHELNWFGGKWYLPSDEMIEMDGVIAWMEKPKPYTEPAEKIAEVGERDGV